MKQSAPRSYRSYLIIILFSVVCTVLILLLSYKLTLTLTTLTPAQNEVFTFLEKGIAPSYWQEKVTAEEQAHLNDVRDLMSGIDIIFILSLLLLLGLLRYYYNHSSFVQKLLRWGGITSIVIVLLLLLLLGLSFNLSFTIFHLLLFPQGNWVFPTDSFLIQTFPRHFFLIITSKIMIIALLLSVGTFFLSKKIFIGKGSSSVL